MQFETALTLGTLLKRYKRFLADIQLESGAVITAHCPNSGSMLGLNAPGLKVALTKSANPARKHAYTLEMVQIDTTWVGVNTNWPNKLFKEGIATGAFAAFKNYDRLESEVWVHKKSRLDFKVSNADKHCFVEVKNVTLKQGEVALFPDAVTQRGAKHLQDLMDAVQQGHAATLFFCVQRDDCQVFQAAKDIDPHYANLLNKAVLQGVTVLCYAYSVSPEAIQLKKQLEVVSLHAL